MIDFPKTVIVRHKRENLKKCSLRGLEKREDFQFFTYPLKKVPELSNYVLLSMDTKEPLSEKDANCGLLLLDGTWKIAAAMEKNLACLKSLQKRRLPVEVETAYPRRQTGCCEPESGLASIEALFVSYLILKREAIDLLDHYYWKDLFIKKNGKLSIFQPFC